MATAENHCPLLSWDSVEGRGSGRLRQESAGRGSGRLRTAPGAGAAGTRLGRAAPSGWVRFLFLLRREGRWREWTACERVKSGLWWGLSGSTEVILAACPF